MKRPRVLCLQIKSHVKLKLIAGIIAVISAVVLPGYKCQCLSAFKSAHNYLFVTVIKRHTQFTDHSLSTNRTWLLWSTIKWINICNCNVVNVVTMNLCTCFEFSYDNKKEVWKKECLPAGATPKINKEIKKELLFLVFMTTQYCTSVHWSFQHQEPCGIIFSPAALCYFV